MKIIRTLHIAPDEFFDRMMSDVLSDLARTVGEGVVVPDRASFAAGLSFVKYPEDRYRATTVHIVSYEDGRLYEARMESMADTVTVRYAAEEDPKGVRVVFEQTMASFDAKRKGPLKSFSEAVYLGRMAEQLLTLERHVLDARAGIEHAPAPQPPERKLAKKLMEKMARD